MMTVETLAFASRRQQFSALCGIYGGGGDCGSLRPSSINWVHLYRIRITTSSEVQFLYIYTILVTHIFCILHIYLAQCK